VSEGLSIQEISVRCYLFKPDWLDGELRAIP
jgi:hypothetical protein